MTDDELLKLYLSVHEWAGTWDILIEEYRRRSDSKATDASLRAWLSKRVNDLRRDTAWVYGEERAKRMVPKLKPWKHSPDLSHDTFGFLIADMLKGDL